MEQEKLTVPYIVYEGEMARNERHMRRLTITLIVAIALMFISNGLWLWAWNQYDYSGSGTETVTIDSGEGVANYIGNDGRIVNGADNGREGTDAEED